MDCPIKEACEVWKRSPALCRTRFANDNCPTIHRDIQPGAGMAKAGVAKGNDHDDSEMP